MSNTIELTRELGTNFIEYAMAVNTDRSLPDAKTGLKPVHRRILFDCVTNGYSSNKPHIKCATVVGDTMGHYHPHGDSSIYGALVRLSQPWEMRYPLIDWHGNNGNISGDPPASYRYTECRLSKLSEEGLLLGLKKDVVDFIPNYSESTTEPVTLPSYFPNLLVNPNTGIGVAMACSWLPHNLKEVYQAVLDVLSNKEPLLQGPDFPTGGLIINRDDIDNIMRTGKGSIKLRGQYKIEDNCIVFYEIPYGITTESILDEIGVAADKDKLDGVKEIRDESSKKSGLRIVIECNKNASIKKIIDTLFKETNLQTSISYNQVALVDKEPKLLNLKDCINIFLDHGIECIGREAQFDLHKDLERKEIVDGLLKALEDIDNIISLIKASKSANDAKLNLISKYQFTDPQAKAIVDMKLGKLANLEKIELQQEYANLMEHIEYLNGLSTDLGLAEHELMNRFKAIVDKYGDERRTQLIQLDVSKDNKEVPVVDPIDCIINISNKNVISRVELKKIKTQNRNSVGTKNNGNIITFAQRTNTEDTLMIFTTKGKMYRVLVDNIPDGKGAPIETLVEFAPDEKSIAYTTLKRDNNKDYILFTTKQGLIKKTPLKEYNSMKKSGVLAIKFKDDDELVSADFIQDEDIILLTRKGMCIRLNSKEIPISSRVAQGVKGMKLSDGDEVISSLIVAKNDISRFIATVSKEGLGKLVSMEEFTPQARGGRGIIIYKGILAGGILVDKDCNIIINGDRSSVIIPSKELPITTRVAMGNIVIKNNKEIISIAKA